MCLCFYINLLLLLIFFLIYFYRSPKVIKNRISKALYSPSYGKILEIFNENDYYHICIFLSPTDVHYQYFPVDSTIKNIIYDNTGKYNLAYELNKSNLNEKCIHILDTIYGEIVIYQIAGFLTRRIDHFKNKGDIVKSGEKLGIIHFGSRVDIRIPKKNFMLKVKKGDKLKGGNSIIGFFI